MYGNTGCFSKFIAPNTPQPIVDSPSADAGSREKRGLSAFYTFLDKKHGDFFALQVKIADKVLGLFLLLRLK
jgi:hypothetical protein